LRRILFSCKETWTLEFFEQLEKKKFLDFFLYGVSKIELRKPETEIPLSNVFSET